MARKPRTQELWDRLVAAFRIYPGNYSHAARFALCDDRTAKAAWLKGWPEQKKQPIADMIREDRRTARAERMMMIERERREQRERDSIARKDAVTTLVQEGRLVATTRHNAIALSSVTAKLAQAALPLADRLKNSLDTTALSPKDAVSVLRGVVYIARHSAVLTSRVLEMERLRLGDPIDPNKIGDADDANVDVASIVADLRDLNETLTKAKEHGWNVEADALGDDLLGEGETESALEGMTDLEEEGDDDDE